MERPEKKVVLESRIVEVPRVYVTDPKIQESLRRCLDSLYKVIIQSETTLDWFEKYGVPFTDQDWWALMLLWVGGEHEVMRRQD